MDPPRVAIPLSDRPRGTVPGKSFVHVVPSKVQESFRYEVPSNPPNRNTAPRAGEYTDVAKRGDGLDGGVNWAQFVPSHRQVSPRTEVSVMSVPPKQDQAAPRGVVAQRVDQA